MKERGRKPREGIHLPPGAGREYPMGRMRAGAVPACALNFSTPGDFEKNMPAIAAWFAENPPGRPE